MSICIVLSFPKAPWRQTTLIPEPSHFGSEAPSFGRSGLGVKTRRIRTTMAVSRVNDACMPVHVARRIMADPPEALLALKENSNWGGSFFNWNDDFTGSDYGDGRSARLWACEPVW